MSLKDDPEWIEFRNRWVQVQKTEGWLWLWTVIVLLIILTLTISAHAQTLSSQVVEFSSAEQLDKINIIARTALAGKGGDDGTNV